ncbi:MAG: hypothetical protein KA186_13585 [Flavobacteriales bacterium]|nr:hypothetical protein [Flavobacteriales bacterium]
MQLTAAMVVDNAGAITECAIPHWQAAARGVGPGRAWVTVLGARWGRARTPFGAIPSIGNGPHDAR